MISRRRPEIPAMPLRTFRWPLLALLCISSSRLSAQTPEFGRHITPILYQLGCSAGACHGAFAGKGGLRLALFAGNNETDHLNLRGSFGRRIDPHRPEQSLLLLKPTGAIEHGGGVRLAKDSWQYRLLRDWIAGGAKFDAANETRVLSIRVEPASITLASAKPQSLKVLAKLSTGVEEDVTKFTKFESLDADIAAVDVAGIVTGKRAGDVAVLAHYAGQVGFATMLVPGPATAWKGPAEQPRDKVDGLLLQRLQALNIVPSPVCDDLNFLRRAYLDVIGQLPTPDEIRAFETDQSPDKRAQLVDRLLRHPLHAAIWAGKLCDMVGADDRFLGEGVYQFHDWFRNKLEANTPWDRLAYGVLCSTAADDRAPVQILADQKREAEERKKLKEELAKNKDYKPKLPEGKQPWQVGYAERGTLDVFYNNLIHQQTIPDKGRIIDSRKVALRVAHGFLGVRLECAQCHKHPNDRWSQADFLRFATIFAHVHYGADPVMKAQKVNLAGVHAAEKPVETFDDPDTQLPLTAHLLGGAAIDVKPGVDPRKVLWNWLTSPDNPYFARAIVNRVWAHYLGRGFIEPADAQAAANPPSHPEVLDELVREFIATKYDLRQLHRRVLMTLAYQRDWRTNATNARDERNYSHRALRRLTAEQALDAIAQVTGTPLKFPKRFATPRDGVKAAELALSRVGGDDGYVLQIFGRPIRVQNCDCERSGAASLSQTLYLFNDEKLLAKIGDPKGHLKQLVDATADDAKLLEELYLLTLTRRPTVAEAERTYKHLREAASRWEGWQDVMWSLLNRHDFVINR
jgi:hypothetical protein